MFKVFCACLLVVAVLELLDIRLALELLLFMLAVIVGLFLAFAVAFSSFARSLGESATSWLVTIVFLPVIGLLLAYIHLGKKYEDALRGD